MKRVEVIGWKRGFLSISFLKLLRESGEQRLSLPEAKDLVDQIVAGKAINIDFHENEEAAAFIRGTAELGAVTSIPTDISDELKAEIPRSETGNALPFDSRKYVEVDPASVSEEDIDSLAEAWLACWRLPMSSPEGAELQWIMTLEYDLLEDAPEMLWLLILAVHGKDESRKLQEVLSAGPLEDLLGRHGTCFIDRVEERARKDPSFAKLLGGVWEGAMPEDVWLRVQAVWNRRGWDGIPE